MISKWKHTFLPITIGFGLGACASLLVIWVPNLSLDLPRIPSVNYQTETSPAEELLEQADYYMQTGEPEKVKGLILPVIESWDRVQDIVAGYKLVGDAEVQQGHYQLAIPYYEKVYYYEPSPDSLFLLAYTYDMSGDLCLAHYYYSRLADWTGYPKGDIDMDFVNERIEEIECSITPPTP